MSFNASSYFAGVGTVVVVMALGFGAGLQMIGMLDKPLVPNKLERRVAAQAAADEVRAAADFMARSGVGSAPDIGTLETGILKTRILETKTVAAPEAPKPAAPVEPVMAPAQRMKQAFSLQPSPAVQPGAPEDAYAKASDAEIEKAKLAAAAEQKAQQRRLAAERRRQREARLNAAAEWARRQPLEIARPPRSIAGSFFAN